MELSTMQYVTVCILLLNAGGAYAYIKSSQNTALSKILRLTQKLEGSLHRINDLEKFRNEKTPLLNHFSKSENIIEAKLDDIKEKVIELKVKAEYYLTMKEARNELVSKDEFKRVEAHLLAIERLIKDRNDK